MDDKQTGLLKWFLAKPLGENIDGGCPKVD